MEERNYWLAFSGFPGIGPVKFKKLLEKFRTAKNAWEAASLTRRPLTKLIGEEQAEKFEGFKKAFSLEDYIKKLKEKDVWFVTLQDKDYPELLKEIKNPPYVLYGKGNKELLVRQPRVSNDARGNHLPGVPQAQHHLEGGKSGLPHQTIAVVGSRKTTQYGREVTKLLTGELVANGFTIVSGLALGVDAISHMTALENNGSPGFGEAGKTIAVLGCGVDCCFPRENLSIYNSILESGNCIVSQFPLGMAPARWTFPARNRIIAGLSQAVLVTEGAEDSGSLITAGFALKFNRKVFAVPGPITSQMSRGPYKLIAKGAKLVTSAQDILRELKVQSEKLKVAVKNLKLKDATEEELKILELLQNEPLHFDEIVRKTGFKSSKLSSILSLMEIKGQIKSLDGGMFSI